MGQVLDESKHTVLAEDYILCESVSSKARGLMFRDKSYAEDHCLIFPFNEEKYQSLHMFFVFFPIDLIFLDGDFKVVEIKRRFSPFTVYNSERKSKYVIELPQGAVASSGTKIGDVISW